MAECSASLDSRSGLTRTLKPSGPIIGRGGGHAKSTTHPLTPRYVGTLSAQTIYQPYNTPLTSERSGAFVLTTSPHFSVRFRASSRLSFGRRFRSSFEEKVNALSEEKS